MDKKTILPFDMSLRFWSEAVPFDDLGGGLGLPAELLSAKGRPMTGKAPIAGRIAKHHFVAVSHEKGTAFADVTDWLRRTARAVAADSALVRLMKTGEVKSLFWIAMFGRDPVPTPTLDPNLVASIVRVHSQVMIENYTPTYPDYPTKTWFPDRA